MATLTESCAQVSDVGARESHNAGFAATSEKSHEQLTLLPLRENIDLYPGSPQEDGSPTWVLHDPVTNRFAEIGWQEFEIVHRWHLANIDAIVMAVNSETTLDIDANDVRIVLMFLRRQQFLKIEPKTLFEMGKAAWQVRSGFLSFLVSHYLFFRIPLLRPDTFLLKTLWLVRPVFSRFFRFALIAIALTGFFLVMRQWDVFMRTTVHFFTLDSLGFYFAAVLVAKCIHELGHAYSCKYYGLHVPVIGLAFLAFVPFLYTDTSESWKLTSRTKRFNIVAAGMAAECGVAVACTFGWSILPPGALRDAAYFLATTSWFMTLLVNISPFMRWDGYYLLSDMVGIKNLQPRSIELAKWRVREWILGFGDSPPEDLPRTTHRFMIVYAFGVWLYRVSVFFGIALMVYHFFLKALGIVLGGIEIIWFIWLPVQREMIVWYRRRKEMCWNKQSIFSVSLMLLLFALFALPWKNYVLLPGVIRPASFVELYPSVSAKIEKVYVKENQQVDAGAPLFDLDSTELNFHTEQALAEIRFSQALLQRSANENTLLREQREVAIQQNNSAVQLYHGLQKKKAQLHIEAPFAGVIVHIPEAIQPGISVSENTVLGVFADPKSFIIAAYADAEQIDALHTGAEGKFYPENSREAPLTVILTEISTVNSEFLAEPLLASVNKGPIAVEYKKDKEYKPMYSVFLVQFAPENSSEGIVSTKIQRGYIRVASERRSYASQVWHNFHSLLIRESGF